MTQNYKRMGAMKKREPFPQEVLDRETRVNEALEAAHKLPHGPERTEALKRAAAMRADDAEAYMESHDLKSPD